MKRWFAGEFLGTFILVFVGCGAVGYSIVNPDFNLLKIALAWAMGVSIAITISSAWCFAHLNPAVSLAFTMIGKISFKRFLGESLAQLLGAMVAAVILYLLFNNELLYIEKENGWIRDQISGNHTAKMFGEFYNHETTPLLEATLIEGFGTSILILMVLIYSESFKANPLLVALFIGLTVGVLITFIAPITQCGINPARDLGPRIVSWVSGWEKAFNIPGTGAITTYVFGPFLGTPVGVGLYKLREKLILR